MRRTGAGLRRKLAFPVTYAVVTRRLEGEIPCLSRRDSRRRARARVAARRCWELSSNFRERSNGMTGLLRDIVSRSIVVLVLVLVVGGL